MTAPRLGSRLFGLADEGKRAVVVDLSDVTFMDSTGIGVLLNALRHFTVRHRQARARVPDRARPAPVRDDRAGGPPYDRRLAREGPRRPRLRSAAGAGILVAVLLEALGRAVLGRRRVVLGRVRGSGVGGRRPLGRERLGRRVDGRGGGSVCSTGGRRSPSRRRQLGQLAGGLCRLVVPAAARERPRPAAAAAAGPEAQRSTAGSRRPQCGQSFRSFWTSCSREHPHSRRFSTE